MARVYNMPLGLAPNVGSDILNDLQYYGLEVTFIL